MTYLLDTNVLSEFERPRPDGNVFAWLHGVDENETYVSVISIGELRRGAALLPASRRKARLEEWIYALLAARFEGRVLDVTTTIAGAWGELMAQARKRGLGLSTMDAYIAATAQVHGMVLVTRNTKDFRGFHVKLVNPWLPARS